MGHNHLSYQISYGLKLGAIYMHIYRYVSYTIWWHLYAHVCIRFAFHAMEAVVWIEVEASRQISETVFIQMQEVILCLQICTHTLTHTLTYTFVHLCSLVKKRKNTLYLLNRAFISWVGSRKFRALKVRHTCITLAHAHLHIYIWHMYICLHVLMYVYVLGYVKVWRRKFQQASLHRNAIAKQTTLTRYRQRSTFSEYLLILSHRMILKRRLEHCKQVMACAYVTALREVSRLCLTDMYVYLYV